MPKFLIERAIPGLGGLSADELRAVSQKSNAVLAGLAPRVQWQQSYITQDTLFCVYIAEDEDAVREHARGGGFPANRVLQVAGVIDPTTGD
jgi:hypothetical protein